MVRATRLTAESCPKRGSSRSMINGKALGPSTSDLMMGSQASSRYFFISLTRAPESMGRLPGMMRSDWSPRCQSSEIARAMSLNTPRVRWNLSSADQSPNNRSNISGWIG